MNRARRSNAVGVICKKLLPMLNSLFNEFYITILGIPPALVVYIERPTGLPIQLFNRECVVPLGSMPVPINNAPSNTVSTRRKEGQIYLKQGRVRVINVPIPLVHPLTRGILNTECAKFGL